NPWGRSALSQTLQRFEGQTIQDALNEAVRCLGPDVKVVDARKVRSGGVGGFFGKERFEVTIEHGALCAPAPVLPAKERRRRTAEPVDAEARLNAALAAVVEEVE